MGPTRLSLAGFRLSKFRTASTLRSAVRVMMALINNWDLKDENNSVYEIGDKSERKAGESR